MRRRLFIIAAVIAILTGGTKSFPANQDDRGQLLKVREAVWRSWFANDASTLRLRSRLLAHAYAQTGQTAAVSRGHERGVGAAS